MESKKVDDVKVQVPSNKVILGDDLGAETFFSLFCRLEFTDIPYLRYYNVRPFVFADYVFYPPHHCNLSHGTLGLKSIKQFSRGGLGFGLSAPMPINDMLSIHVYHNALLFNCDRTGSLSLGDIYRTGAIEIDFGIF